MSPAGYERRALQGAMARDAATPKAADCADHGGIVQAYPAGDRRSWGILEVAVSAIGAPTLV